MSLPTVISVNFDSGSSGAYATPRNASSEGYYRHAGVSRRVGGYPNLLGAGQNLGTVRLFGQVILKLARGRNNMTKDGIKKYDAAGS